MRRTLLAALLVGLVVVASTAGSARPDAQAARDPKEIQSLLEQRLGKVLGAGCRVLGAASGRFRLHWGLGTQRALGTEHWALGTALRTRHPAPGTGYCVSFLVT